jgi:dihydrolipoamide dehydrogenase
MLDAVIIGAGTAGLAALKQVRKRTERFLIINDGPYGTTCARVGCMPSKALIESANAFARREHFAALGIHGAGGLQIDRAAVLARVRALRDDFVRGIVRLTDDVGDRSIAGRARFVAPDAIEVNGRRIQAKSFIIAAGSRPITPADWNAFSDRLLTSDTLFEQETLPARIAVVGLGVIGCEIAQALARLGVEVTAFGAGQRVAGIQDPRINDHAIALLRRELTVHLGARATLTADRDGVRVTAGDANVVVDRVFAALGRRANVDDLGLEQLGVALDDDGMPPFNRESLQIADLPIFFAGDVNGEWPVLHEAADDGYISGLNALEATPSCFQRRTHLAIVFTDPNIAVVGERFDTLDPARLAIGEVDFSRQGRARVAAENRGGLRVYADRTDGRLRGAELCAPRGEHLAHLLALAMAQGLTVQQLLGAPFYHPVYEEGLRTALRDASNQLATPVGSDLANCEPVGAAALD